VVVDMVGYGKGASRGILPGFELPSSRGYNIALSDYRQRQHLIIVFVRDARCVACQSFLREFKERYGEVRESSEALAIIGGERGIAEDLHRQMDLPYPFLFDPENKFVGKVLEDERVMSVVVLVDRYGAVWKRFVPEREDGSLDVDEVIKWLGFMELQCPECGVPDNPPGGM
jgi:peroxiredoxin